MKEATEIYESMRATFREKTGMELADNAELSVRLYAAAAELESLYGYCDWVMRQSFPQTAAGENLDRHAKLRGLVRKAAACARGQVTFFLQQPLQQDVAVPAGTVCTTAGSVRFLTEEDGVIPAGAVSVTLWAAAEEPGAGGNVAQDTVTHMVQPPAFVAGCTNGAAFSGGRAEEDDDALRLRVLASFRRLPNGANSAFYEERALSHDGVAGVQVLPKRRGVGTVDVVIAAADGMPAEALLLAVQQDLQAVREIAVDVQVSAPEARPVDVTLTVWPEDDATGEAAVAAARQAITAYFDGSRLGQAVYPARLGQAVLATGKVKNYLLSSPQETFAAEAGTLPVLGQLTVTEGL